MQNPRANWTELQTNKQTRVHAAQKNYQQTYEALHVHNRVEQKQRLAFHGLNHCYTAQVSNALIGANLYILFSTCNAEL